MRPAAPIFLVSSLSHQSAGLLSRLREMELATGPADAIFRDLHADNDDTAKKGKTEYG
jgi:hypothetical protein